MKALCTLSMLLILSGCLNIDDQWINTVAITKWEEAPNLQMERQKIFYKPEMKMGSNGRMFPMIKLEVTFKNTGPKVIQSATFEILLFCQSGENDSELRQFNVKPFTYPGNIAPGEEAMFLYQPSTYELRVPVKQIVRVSEIEYTDGTVWKRD